MDKLNILAKILVQSKNFSEDIILCYQNEAATRQQSLFDYLIINNIFTSLQLATLLAQNYKLPLLDLNSLHVPFVLDLLNKKLIQQYKILPLYKRGLNLFIGLADPSSFLAIQAAEFYSNLTCLPIIIEANKLYSAIQNLLTSTLDHQKLPTNNETGTNQSYELPNLILNNLSLNNNSHDEAPIISFVNKILQEAIVKKASDIHFEIYETAARIRYRINGELIETLSYPLQFASRIITRIKILANLDITQKRLPQDGRFKLKITSSESIDCRVNVCPTIDGEKIVIRLLNLSLKQFSIDELGFTKKQKKLFLTTINKSQGMIILTGPTGSGKTITIYSALNFLNKQNKNISTVEDPVEIKIHGINQISVNPNINLNFATILRAFLRQDPDIIMVGEMRDYETASIALKASQTGHLVLSSLHTTSAVTTITRLLNMGIPAYNLADTINLIIAQRLVKKLCNYCKRPHENINNAYLEKLSINVIEKPIFFQAQGCNQCINGYQGRIALFECLPISQTITNLILREATITEILTQARMEGMMSLYEFGWLKVQQGLTTIEQIQQFNNE